MAYYFQPEDIIEDIKSEDIIEDIKSEDIIEDIKSEDIIEDIKSEDIIEVKPRRADSDDSEDDSYKYILNQKSERSPSPERISKDELSFVEEVPKQIVIECPVCLNILTDPHQVSCCGHIFCGSCIERVRASDGSCPMCKEERYQSFADKNVSRIVNGLQVYCTNKAQGCQWKGALKDLPTHLNKEKREGECQYEEVKCQYVRCQKKDQRQNLTIHEKENCNQRPYKCVHCARKGRFIFIIGKHFNTCPKYPTKCPNNCAQKIPRESIPYHLNVCPFQPVDCVYSWAGCNDKPLRKDVHVHTADTKHMTLLAVACKQLKEENEQMKKESEKMKKMENAQMFSYLGVINRDTYPFLPVTIRSRDDVVHFYTEVGGHHMSAVLVRSMEKNKLYLAFHEGKFDKLHELKCPKILVLRSGDTEPVLIPIKSYQKVAHRALTQLTRRESRVTMVLYRLQEPDGLISLPVDLDRIKSINIVLTSPNEVTIFLQ